MPSASLERRVTVNGRNHTKKKKKKNIEEGGKDEFLLQVAALEQGLGPAPGSCPGADPFKGPVNGPSGEVPAVETHLLFFMVLIPSMCLPPTATV